MGFMDDFDERKQFFDDLGSIRKSLEGISANHAGMFDLLERIAKSLEDLVNFKKLEFDP